MDGRGARAGVGLLAPWLATLGLWGCQHSQAQIPPASPDSTADAYSGSVAALMWPGATRAYQVTARGDLFNGAWFVRVEPGSDGLTAGAPRRIAYEDRWCPVVRWTRVSGPVRWDFEAVAFAEGEPAPWSPRGTLARFAAARGREWDRAREEEALAALPQERLTRLLIRAPRPLERNPVDRRNLFVSWLATATNTGATVADARLDLRFDPPGDAAPYRDPDSLVRTPWNHCWHARAGGDSVLGFAEGEVSDRTLSRSWHLRPGERASLRAILPAYPTPAAELVGVASVPHELRADGVRAYWRGQVERGAAFDVPDPLVRDAVRAARVVLLAARERRDIDWVPLGGPFHYRDVWLRDGARIAEALAVSGYTRESREAARAFLRFQSPLGSFVSQRGQLDGTGEALWAFEQTLLRPSPAPELREFAAAAVQGWRAVQRQRDLTRAPCRDCASSMLPETDPHDDELVRAQLVGNDAWSLAGYRATERLLRAAGEPSTADQVERSRREYLAAFRRALDRTGCADVPPSWQRIGIDWGNLNIGYPCEVLEANDPRLESLAERYWAPVGGPGLGYYHNPDSLHTYVAADLGTVAMLAGDRAAAERILDAMLYWRTASGGAAECFSASTRSFGANFPPHATAAAALISLIRNALVFDDLDTLALTLGARATWWTGTTVRQAPTRWGRLDLQFARVGDLATWRWSAVPVWTLLTLPPGARAASIPAPLRAGPRPDQLLAPPRETSARVALASGTDSRAARPFRRSDSP